MTDVYWTALDWDFRSAPGRKALGDCVEAHRTIMSAFPELTGTAGDARARLGVLWRHEPQFGARTLVQSVVAPDERALAMSTVRVESKRVELGRWIMPGRTLRFEAVLNPARKVDTKTRSDGRRSNGRRVPLRRLDDQVTWLARRLEAIGGSLATLDTVPDLMVADEVRHEGWKATSGSTGRRVTHEGVRVLGRCVVEDAERFQAGLMAGIGPGKAYGFGLMTVLP